MEAAASAKVLRRSGSGQKRQTGRPGAGVAEQQEVLGAILSGSAKRERRGEGMRRSCPKKRTELHYRSLRISESEQVMKLSPMEMAQIVGLGWEIRGQSL